MYVLLDESNLLISVRQIYNNYIAVSAQNKSLARNVFKSSPSGLRSRDLRVISTTR